MMKKHILVISVACLMLMTGCATPPTRSLETTAWTSLVKLAGVPNLHKVSDDLYRSAQPSAQGMHNLKQMGIERVVNLRSFHSDRDEIGYTGLGYEHIYMKAWYPERKEVVRFLRIVTNPKRTPVLVHCQHGADRTGTMCGLYRIAVQGWMKEKAIREMTEGGFGFHEVWKNLPDWIRQLDIESIKKDAGINASTEQSPAGDVLKAGPREYRYVADERAENGGPLVARKRL